MQHWYSGGAMDLDDIRLLVPHEGHMVLLDRVVEACRESVTAELEIRPDSLFCEDGGVGAWVGLEYMAQAIAAHAGHLARQRGDAVKVGFLEAKENITNTVSMMCLKF